MQMNSWTGEFGVQYKQKHFCTYYVALNLFLFQWPKLSSNWLVDKFIMMTAHDERKMIVENVTIGNHLWVWTGTPRESSMIFDQMPFCVLLELNWSSSFTFCFVIKSVWIWFSVEWNICYRPWKKRSSWTKKKKLVSVLQLTEFVPCECIINRCDSILYSFICSTQFSTKLKTTFESSWGFGE